MVSFLIGTILPLAVAYVTKASWSTQVKGVVTLVLAGVTSVLTQWVRTLTAHAVFHWQGVVLAAVITFVTSAISDQHVWHGGTAKTYLHTKGCRLMRDVTPAP